MLRPSNSVLSDAHYLELFDREFAAELIRIGEASTSIRKLCLRGAANAGELTYLAEIQDCLDAIEPHQDGQLYALARPVAGAIHRAVVAHPEWLDTITVLSPALEAARNLVKA